MPYPNLTLTIYKKKKRFDAKCSFKTKIFRNELHASFYPFSVKSMFQFIWSYGGKKNRRKSRCFRSNYSNSSQINYWHTLIMKNYFFFSHSYCKLRKIYHVSKKSCLNVYSDSRSKNWQDFKDIKYSYSSIYREVNGDIN